LKPSAAGVMSQFWPTKFVSVFTDASPLVCRAVAPEGA
jgi:hypothetical protein